MFDLLQFAWNKVPSIFPFYKLMISFKKKKAHWCWTYQYCIFFSLSTAPSIFKVLNCNCIIFLAAIAALKWQFLLLCWSASLPKMRFTVSFWSCMLLMYRFTLFLCTITVHQTIPKKFLLGNLKCSAYFLVPMHNRSTRVSKKILTTAPFP